MIVDLSGVELMNSAGLGLLIASANMLSLYNKVMILLNPNPRVEHVIRIACLQPFLPVVFGMLEALKKIKGEK